MSVDARTAQQEMTIAEEYASSLADLTVNSKPLINMLTMLAEENVDYAGVIVKVIEKHLAQVYYSYFLFLFYFTYHSPFLFNHLVRSWSVLLIPLFRFICSDDAIHGPTIIRLKVRPTKRKKTEDFL